MLALVVLGSLLTPAQTDAATAGHFVVRPDGSTYHAESQTSATTYSGTLKFVVESAVSDLKRARGGTITFGSGTFDLGTDRFVLHDVVNITFEGQGIDVTIVRNETSATADSEPFDVHDTSGMVVRDMTIIAGGAARSSSDAMDFDGGNDTLIERVKIAGSRGRGIVFDGKDLRNGLPRTADRNVVRDCVITAVASDGIELLASNDNVIEGCRITDTGGHGIQLTKASPMTGQPNKKSNANAVRGNVIDNAGQDGINVTSGDGNEITANTVTNSSDDTSGRDGIRIHSADLVTCDDNIVSGNTSTDTQATKTQRYGLAITSSNCHRTVVKDNKLQGNRTGAVLDQGTGTIFVAPDTTPPSAPTNLTATAASPTQVDLSWAASTDNVGVTGYRIYRGTTEIATSTTTSYSDKTVQPSTTYSYTVEAYDAANNLSAASNSASATTPAPPDTTPPTAPTNLTATAASPRQVDVTWTASTDNVGVTGYRIYRGTNEIAASTTTSYSDETAEPSTTYSYTVKAYDAAGNLSGASNSATVTTPAEQETLTLTPTDDAYVRQDRPTSNFGSETTIQVDNSPVKNLLLKFAVSGVGTRRVVSAKLRLYCVDASRSGGAFRPVRDQSWSEATVNWNNAPAPDTTTLASLGAVSANTWYEVDVTALVTADRSVSLRASSSSSDAARYSSKEGGLAPQLLVTVSS